MSTVTRGHRNAVSLLMFAYVLIFLNSLHMWPLWNVEGIVYNICILIVVILFCIYPFLISFKGTSILPCFLLLLCTVYGMMGRAFILIFFLLLLKDEYKNKLLCLLSKVFSILLLISLAAWLFNLVGFEIFTKEIQYPPSGQAQYKFFCNLLFLVPKGEFEFIPRFQSLFLEPGHLGMAASLLLAANRFRLKIWYCKSLLISAIFTFSLAAYVILFIGLLLKLSVYNKRHFFTSILIIISSITALWLISSSYKNGDNFLYSYIFSRLEFTGGEEIIAGNNRFSSNFNSFYEEFIHTSRKWLGVGAETFNSFTWVGGSSGYKVFIVQYGIIGVILTVMLYLSFLGSKFRFYGFLLVLLFLISYMQRAYPYWPCFLISIICGIPNVRRDRGEKFVLSNLSGALVETRCMEKNIG